MLRSSKNTARVLRAALSAHGPAVQDVRGSAALVDVEGAEQRFGALGRARRAGVVPVMPSTRSARWR